MNDNRIFIDVRDPLEYQVDHIPGAINIPPSELMAGSKQLDSIDKNTELVLYCKAGSRSNVGIQILRRMGFTNLVNGINVAHVTKNYLS